MPQARRSPLASWTAALGLGAAWEARSATGAVRATQTRRRTSLSFSGRLCHQGCVVPSSRLPARVCAQLRAACSRFWAREERQHHLWPRRLPLKGIGLNGALRPAPSRAHQLQRLPPRAALSERRGCLCAPEAASCLRMRTWCDGGAARWVAVSTRAHAGAPLRSALRGRDSRRQSVPTAMGWGRAPGRGSSPPARRRARVKHRRAPLTHPGRLATHSLRRSTVRAPGRCVCALPAHPGRCFAARLWRCTPQVRVVGAVRLLQARHQLGQAALRDRHPAAQRDGRAAHRPRAHQLDPGTLCACCAC